MKEKGITLIALVITIIVMIILVGVTVTIATNGGLFDYAGQASASQRAAMVEEHVSVWKSEKLMAKYAGGSVKSASELLDDLYSQDLITEAEKEEAKTTGIIKIRNKEIVLKSGGETLVSLYNRSFLKKGDYIDFIPPTGAEYIATGDKTGTTGWNQEFSTEKNNSNLKWQVLGLDSKTGGLKLIANDILKSKSGDPVLVLNSAKGYVNGITEINNVCKIFKNELVQEARGVTLEDINQIIDGDLKTANTRTGYGTSFNLTDVYTPESYLKGEKTSISEKDDTFEASTSGIATSKMLVTESRNTYWLGEQSKTFDGTNVWFGLRSIERDGQESIKTMTSKLFESTGDGTTASPAIRPVIILYPYVTEEDIAQPFEYKEPDNINDWSYEVDAKTNTATITGYHGTDETVVIPNCINNVRVTKIQGKEKEISEGNVLPAGSSIWERTICTDKWYNSIASCINQTVKKVVVSEGIEEIGPHAFEFSSTLTEVTICEGVKTIGDWAFYGCYKLGSITIPSSVENMGEFVFSECDTKFQVNVPFTKNQTPSGWSTKWNRGKWRPTSSEYQITVNYAK